jgi:DNA-binding transcriptional MerR regulator
MQQLLTLGSVAQQTGISKPTLRLYADSGLIPCSVDFTGRRLFHTNVIDLALQVREERTRARKTA